MTAADGKQRMTDVADTVQLLRLIQSIPSPKAEPFKRWLAKVGYERLEEIENPELAAKRMRAIYGQKGYSEEWIEKRLRGIAVRDELTDEWSKRGVKEGKEFAILTAEISKATFGMTPAQYKEFKSLSNPKENLRDHMTDLELIFTMLGEASTTEIAKKRDAHGFPQNQQAAKAGGTISPAMPAKPSKPRAATTSPPLKITKPSPNPRNASLAINQTPDTHHLRSSQIHSQFPRHRHLIQTLTKEHPRCGARTGDVIIGNGSVSSQNNPTILIRTPRLRSEPFSQVTAPYAGGAD